MYLETETIWEIEVIIKITSFKKLDMVDSIKFKCLISYRISYTKSLWKNPGKW